MSLDARSIHRSLATMGFRLAQDMDKKKREADGYRLGEGEQQFQIDISGRAEDVPAWESITLTFSETLYVAPGQRDSTNDEPQVWVGSVIESGPPVLAHAFVRQWVQDEDGNFTGAKVTIGAFAPGASGGRFRGRIHLTFQGFGAPDDGDEGTEPGGSTIPPAPGSVWQIHPRSA